MPTGAVARVGLAKQTAFGTRNTSPTPLLTRSYDHNLSVENVEDNEMFGNIDVFDSITGNRSVTANLQTRAYPLMVGEFLTGTLGAPVTTGTTNFTHTFTPGNALPPAYTLAMRTDDTSESAFWVDNARVSQSSIEQTQGQPLVVTTNYVATDRQPGATVSGSVTETAPYLWRHLGVTVNAGAVTTFKNFTVQITNPIENNYSLDGNSVPNFQEFNGRRAITFNGTLRFTTDAASYRTQYEQGQTLNLVLLWTIDANTSLQISIPRLKVTNSTFTKGPGIMDVNVEGKAYLGGANIMQAILRNTRASY